MGGCGFALSVAFRYVLPQERRIATPVCALVRNDMQKTGALLRVQGVVRKDKQKVGRCVQGQGGFPAEKAVPSTRLRRCQCMPSFMDITVRPTVPKIFRFLGLTNKNPLL